MSSLIILDFVFIASKHFSNKKYSLLQQNFIASKHFSNKKYSLLQQKLACQDIQFLKYLLYRLSNINT